MLLLFSIIIIPLSIMLSHQFSKYAFVEINRFTQEKTYQTVDRTKFVLDRMKFFSFSMYTDKRIQEFLSVNEIEPSIHMDVQRTLSNYLLNEPFIHSVYAVNVKNQTVFDSKNGPFTFKNFHDQKILKKIMFDEDSILKYFKHGVNESDFLTLIVNAKVDYDGFLVVMLDIEKLEKYLLQNHHDLEIQVMLLDNRGELVLGGVEETFFQREEINQNKGGNGNIEITINGEPWLANFAALDSYESTIYTMTKISSWKENITNFRKRIIFSSIGLVIILFIIVLWSSRRTYQPFSRLAEHLGKKLSNEIPKDRSQTDINVIKHSIDLLEDNVYHMRQSIREHRPLVKTEYLRQWILQGRIRGPIKNYIEEESRILSHPNFYLMVVRIDSFQLFVEKHNLFTRKVMKFAIGNILEEIIKEKEKDCAVESVDFSSDHIVLLVGLRSMNSEHHKEYLLHAKNQINNYLDINVTIAVSELYKITDDLRPVYDRIYELSNLKFITGEDRIYQENDHDQFNNLMYISSDDVNIEKLIKAVRIGHEEKIKSILDEIMEYMKKISYSECKFQLSLIMYKIIRSYNQHTSLTCFEGIQAQLGKFKTLEEVRQWLESELNHIVKSLKQRKSSNRKIELANEIKEFVDTHIHDPTLSIDMIADHLSLSVSYTRQVYKEAYGHTLSEFILKIRIENVLELLRTTDWNINELAERCGFQTKSNFYTLFKKVVGMTPSQYRDQYKEN
jgi:AraC-like DNA-binding protein